LEEIIINRDIKLSNIKGTLILLVVFGHMIEVYKTDYYDTLLFIYSFHMPLFVFISGYLAKRAKISKIFNLLLIYLIFQTLYYGFISVMSMTFDLTVDYVVPYFHLWYIISMIFWYILALLINKLKLNFIKKLILVILSVIISYLSRFYTEEIVSYVKIIYPKFYSYSFTYQRALTFAPYFLLGFFIKREKLTEIYSSLKMNKIIFLISSVIVLGIFQVLNAENLEAIFKGSKGTEVLVNANINIYLEVLLSYIISIWFGYLFINIINNKRNILTMWGDHSLAIFLFHPFVVITLGMMKNKIQFGLLINFILLFLIAVATTAFLGSKWFTHLSCVICNPYKMIKKIAIKLAKKQ